MSNYALGLDFGTNSCRALLVDLSNGREIASAVFAYPSGEAGVIIDHADPNLARQNPADYLLGIEHTVRQVIGEARQTLPEFSPDEVVGIGVDTTGSSPMPVDAYGMPLCFDERFKDNPAAMVWLWKDHTSFAEAARITGLAAKMRLRYLAKIGGTYSSEWFWSKILRLKDTAPDVFEATASVVEVCDWIPALLTGETTPGKIRRSVCAAGHKAMFSREWGGLPDEEFLEALSPGLGKLRAKLFNEAATSDCRAGFLTPAWANALGLSAKTAVAVGAFDAHMGAVGAGISPGTLVKIIGTSTCDVMISPHDQQLQDIPGVCGIVDGSVINGYYGIEAGQSAVGDIFLWFVNSLVPDSYGSTPDERFRQLELAASQLKPGESGLLALDWNNGNRTILVDVRLTGLLLGQTLHTRPHEIYRSLMEATAYGALVIIDRIEEYGVPIKEIVNCGGLAVRSPLLMQIYADITGRPMKVSRSEQTPALGAAIFGAVAAGKEAGGYATVEDAQRTMTGVRTTYLPDEDSHAVYARLYTLYRELHDAFGIPRWQGPSGSGHGWTAPNVSGPSGSSGLYNVMKDLLTLRDEVRRPT